MGDAAAPEEILAVDEALTKLNQEDPELAKIVNLRYFAGMTTRLLAHAGSAEEQDTMRKWLATWRDNAPQLWPVLKNNALLQELVPISQNLTSVATAGLQALDYLRAGGHAPAAWREQQLAVLEQTGKAQAELLNMIVPSVQKLVAATTPE